MKIYNHEISERNTYVIAEIGNNHNGDFQLALQLIDAAKVFRPTATLTAKLLGPRLTLVHMSMGILTTSFQVIKILFQHFRYLLIILPRQSMMPT